MRSFLLMLALSAAALAQPERDPLFFAADSPNLFFAGQSGTVEGLAARPPGSFLGVGIVEIDAERAKELKLSEERGVLVSRVDPDSPAAKAGLQVGDALLEYNGQRLDGVEQLGRMVHETPAGRKVKLSVWRSGKALALEAVIETRKTRMRGPDVAPMPAIRSFEIPEFGGDLMRNFPRPELAWRTGLLGVECQSIGDQLAEYFGVKQGVLVLSVGKGTPAEKAGLKAGDVITKIGDRAVTNPREVISALHDRSSKDVKVTLTRERKEAFFNVTVEDDTGWGHRQHQPQPRPVSAPQ